MVLDIGICSRVRDKNGIIVALLLFENKMLSSLLDPLYALTQNKHKSVWSLGFLIGLATGLGALAFSKMHKAFVYAYVRRKVLRVSPEHAAKACPYQDEFQPIELVRGGSILSGVEGLIGNTPLVRIQSLSDLTGCDILGKAEFLNPGGSPKDRVALQIIKEAEESNELVPNVGSWIFEGTVGSTGISLATLACAKGYNCCIIVPDNVPPVPVPATKASIRPWVWDQISGPV